MAGRRLYLARHGETDWNRAGRWQGHTDIPLNETGYAQARGIAGALSGVSIAAIVSSDLVRAFETARVVGEALGLSVAFTDVDLRERAFGPFEGLTREECLQRYPEAWRAWTEEHHPPPGAESRTVVAARVCRAIDRVARTAPSGDGAVLIVTHGGALRAAVATVAPLPPPVQNGALWRVDWNERILAAEAFSPGG